MKIALVTSEFPPMNLAAAARVGPWADALSERGHEVLVLSSRNAGETKDSRVIASSFKVPSNQSSLPVRFLDELRLGRDIADSLADLSGSLDGVVITSPPFFMASLSARACRKAGLPYVFDVRDRYPSVLFELGVIRADGWIGKWLSRIESKVYDGASLVTTVTSSLQARLAQLARSKVIHAPNGFDRELFTDDLIDLPKREEFTVVYHGRFSRLHDVETLRETTLEIRRRKSAIRFLVIGPVPDRFRSKEWGATEFMGEVPHDQIPQLLAQCHLGVSFMHDNEATTIAFPAKVFEYLGSGLPVFVSPRGEMTEFLKKEEVGISFSAPSPSELADALTALSGDPDRHRFLAGNVRRLRPDLDRRKGAIRFAKTIEEAFLSEPKPISIHG